MQQMFNDQMERASTATANNMELARKEFTEVQDAATAKLTEVQDAATAKLTEVQDAATAKMTKLTDMEQEVEKAVMNNLNVVKQGAEDTATHAKQQGVEQAQRLFDAANTKAANAHQMAIDTATDVQTDAKSKLKKIQKFKI